MADFITQYSLAAIWTAQTQAFDTAVAKASAGIDKMTAALDKNATQLGKTEKSADKAQSTLSKVGGWLMSTAAVAAGNLVSGAISKIASSITDVVSRGLDFNDILEKSTIAFTTFTGSADRAQKQIETLKKEALTNPFEFTDLLRASQNLTAMGYQAEETIPLIRILSDQVSALGGTAADLESLAEVFGKIRSESSLSGREMRELAIRGIPAYEMLAKAAGKSVQEIKKLSEAGQIDPDSAVTIILAGMQKKTGGLSEKLMNTLSGKLSNWQDALDQSAGKLTGGPTGLYQAYKETVDVGMSALTGDSGSAAIQSLQGYVNKIGQAALLPIRDLAKGDFAQAGADLMTGLMDGMKGAFDMISGPVVQMGKDIMQGLHDGMEGMSAYLQQLPTSISMSMYQAFAEFWKSHSPSRKMFDFGVNLIAGLTGAFTQDTTVDKVVDDFSKKLYGALAKMPKGGWMNKGGDPAPFISDIVTSAFKHGLDPALLAGIFAQETGGFRSSVIYGGENNKAARGIAQFIPATGRQYGLTINDNIDERTDPTKSIEAAAKYVEWLNKLFGGDTDLVLAAYNAGQGAVQKYGNQIPPYAETQNYVKQINKLLNFMGGISGAGAAETSGLDIAKHQFGGDLLGSSQTFPYNFNSKTPMPVFVTNAGEIRGGGAPAGAKALSIDDLNPDQQARAIDVAFAKINADSMKAPKQLDIWFGTLPTKLSHLSDTEIATQKKAFDEIQKKADEATAHLFRQTPEQLARLKVTFKQVGDAFETTFGAALGKFNGSFKQLLSDMVVGFLQAIQQMAAAALAGNLRNLLFGTPTANNEHGGGFLSTLLQWGISAAGAAFGGHFAAPGGGGGGGGHIEAGGSIGIGSHAGGGLISGPGTGTSDSVHAMLSNNEYVIPADAVAYYGPSFLDAIRQRRLGRFAGGGLHLSGSTMGLFPTSSSAVRANDQGQTVNINIHQHFPANRGKAFAPSAEQAARKSVAALNFYFSRDGKAA